MLPNREAVKEAFLDHSKGVIAGVKDAAAEKPVSKLLVECGTIESATILEVGKAVDGASSELPTGSILGATLHNDCVVE